MIIAESVQNLFLSTLPKRIAQSAEHQTQLSHWGLFKKRLI